MPTRRNGIAAALALPVALLFNFTVGCSAPSSPPLISVTMASTTSTRDSGLLNVLVSAFERDRHIQIKVVAVGTGAALEMARRGDADVLLTHAPEAERRLVDEGFGLERREVMHNDFVLVGPAADPAGVAGKESVFDALRGVADHRTLFVSRGDESGTHIKERSLWEGSGVKTSSDWYLAAGSGMAATLRLASEKRAYTLTDRATFLSQKELELRILHEGDGRLTNQYSVILVNPEKHAHVKTDAAREFADWLFSAEARELIGQFGEKKFGQALFFVK